MNTTTTRTCPDIGAWRAWLDNEDHSVDEAHLLSCPACQRLVADLRDEANEVREVLTAAAPIQLPNPAEVAAARERLGWRGAPATMTRNRGKRLALVSGWATRLSTPWRLAASGLAAAIALALVVAFTPQGGSAAAAFLAQFRSQQVTAIAVTPQTQADVMRTMNSLSNLGTIQAPNGTNPARPAAAARAAESQTRTVTLAEAAQTVGFQLLMPDTSTLPAGIGGTPAVRVMPGSQARFTFDKKKAQAYFQSTGHPQVSLPEKFDGASLVVSIPAAAVLEYGDPQTSKDAIVIGEAGELVVDVQGNVSLQEMRDFLLGLPGLPADVVNQLRQIQNWNDTLPIPVPVDQVNWQSATINHSQGLLLNDNSGIGSAALWHANGHLYGVAGNIKATDLKRIADSLAVR